jgi:D-glycero-alpha-D-manno-heptose-7-phosphate kinase
MIVRARAPLRLGLAGGGTDVSPYCDLHGGLVLNSTIARYAYATLSTRQDSTVRFNATDQACSETLSIGHELSIDGKLPLHRAVYSEMMSTYNSGNLLPLEVTTFCDAPAGSGLGASSTLVVALVRAFVEYFNAPLDDYSIARLAYRIERTDCFLQGGHQDQYAATFGGFNFMEFYEQGRVVVNSLRVKNWIVCELEASLLLFHTGVSRESARIISDQRANVESRSEVTLEAMHALKHDAVAMKDCVVRGDLHGFVQSMRSGWENKKRTADKVTTTHIDEIHAAAIAAGASAGKVSGAGGGGFMMFFVTPDRRMDVARALARFDGQISNCNFTTQGTQAWRLP